MKQKIKILIISAVFAVMFIPCMDVRADISEQVSGMRERVEFRLKQPMGKKQIALKFLLAMLGVGASSVIIFVLLSLYNNLMYSGRVRKIGSEADKDLKTPTNMKEALNIFLKKTK